MSRIFFTGDLHFGHENILRFDKRPFSSVEEMNAELVRRWNAKVGADDTVYVLGDMIWRSYGHDAAELIRSLHGRIVLIRGNHDSFLQSAEAKSALADVKDYDESTVKLNNGTARKCVLAHYFIPLYNGHFRQAIHLHAHSHFTPEADIEVDIADKLNEAGIRVEIYNVGCMYWGYEPVTLDEILAHGETVRPNYGER